MSYVTWFQNLNIPWLTGGPNAQKYWAAIGSVFDDQVANLKAAVKCRFPTLAPSDALGFLGDERQLDRGPQETDPGYALRVRGAWETCPRAGTPAGLLLALYYGGFPGAVVVQQNGYAFELGAQGASVPAPKVAYDFGDANFVLWVTQLGTNPAIGGTKPIPAGTVPWWAFDATDLDAVLGQFASRFAVLFPQPLPSVFITAATATFTGVEDGSLAHPWPTVTWPNVFPDTTYAVMPGAPVITDGSGPVIVAVDGTSKTTSSIAVKESAPFAGTVDMLAYQRGACPFADLHPVDLARLRSIIGKWRDGAKVCTGIHALVQGAFFDWPVRTFDSAGGTFGVSTVVSFTP